MCLLREFSLELGFQRHETGDEFVGGLFEGLLRCDRTVGLDLDLEVRVQRMGDLVAGEKNVRGREELPVIAGLCQKSVWVIVDDHTATHALSMFPRVWSCFTILIVAALGILVSSVTSTLKLNEYRCSEMDESKR